MAGWLKNLFRDKYKDEVERANAYLTKYYVPSAPDVKESSAAHNSFYDSDIKFSERTPVEDSSSRDRFNSDSMQSLLRHVMLDSSIPLDRGVLKQMNQYMNISFVDQMFKLMRQKKLLETDVYKAAQIDRRLFSKIRSDSGYKPRKDTCLALCFAMELTLEEAEDLISRAGYTLSHSNQRDVVMEFLFKEKIYNLHHVNVILHKLGLATFYRAVE